MNNNLGIKYVLDLFHELWDSLRTAKDRGKDLNYPYVYDHDFGVGYSSFRCLFVCLDTTVNN
jgi:hypothetical protein